MARGYLNNPDLTAEKFIPNPFSDLSGRRLYKTGDLCRYLNDGNIEFLGRIDDQVKIRGLRIELEEIESVLHQHPSIRAAAVLTFEDSSNNKRLIAYIVLVHNSDISSDRLRKFLKEKLPYYMVPSTFFFLDAMPLTPNGKIDRSALPAPDKHSLNQKSVFVSPRTPIEKLIADQWSKAFNLQKVSIYDNFFEIGGHSLMATKIISQLSQIFGMEIPLYKFFESPTVEEMAIVITQMLAGQIDQKDLNAIINKLDQL